MEAVKPHQLGRLPSLHLKSVVFNLQAIDPWEIIPLDYPWITSKELYEK